MSSIWFYKLADEDFTKDIDAAFFVDQDDPTKDKAYMLKGGQYVRLPFVVGGSTAVENGYPKSIANWHLDPNFESDIDAAFFSKKREKLYMLKGDQYIRLPFVPGDTTEMDEGYPKPISNWGGLPPAFQSDIDAAFLSDKRDKLYMLKGDEYVRLTFIVGQGAEMDAGYPKYISDWI